MIVSYYDGRETRILEIFHGSLAGHRTASAVAMEIMLKPLKVEQASADSLCHHSSC